MSTLQSKVHLGLPVIVGRPREKAKHLLKSFRKTNLEGKEKKDTDTSNRNGKRLAYVQARKEQRRPNKEKKSVFKREKKPPNFY